MNTHHVYLHRSPFLRGLFCLHASLCLIGTALLESRAQQAPASGASPTGSAASEEVVKLSPFEVTSDQDVGYLANNTLAGSRFSTPLKDTPASISVLTSEFLSDIGAFQLEEALEYAVNIEFFQDDDRVAINNNAIFQGYQSYRTRGLDSSRSRNYFTSAGRAAPDEMAFVDRIEDSRGPNSVLFGIASPGGVINTSTKQANVGRAFQKGSVTYGIYDTKRATIDLNQPVLDGKLAVRLNLVYNDNNEFRHFVHQTHQRALLSATYQLSERTKLKAEFERGQLETNKSTGHNLTGRAIPWMDAGRQTFATQTAKAAAGTALVNTGGTKDKKTGKLILTPRVTYVANDGSVLDMQGTLVANTGANNAITDRSISDQSINFGGPAQNRFARFGIFSAYLEHQLGENTFLELGFNHSDNSFDNRDPRVNANQLLGDPNQKLNGANQTFNGGPANPYAGDLYLETNWFRTVRWDQGDVGRATLSHELDAGKWGNYQMAGLWEYEKRFFLSRTFREVWYNATTGQLGPFHADPVNAQNNVYRRTYVTEGDWGSYHVDGPVGSGGLLTGVFDPFSGLTLGSTWVRQGAPNETYVTTKSGMFVTQARYFNNRLIIAGGLRRDEYDEMRLATQKNPGTQIWEVVRDSIASTNSTIGRTKTIGAVYHVPTPESLRNVGVSLFYNKSDNVSVPASNLMLHPSGDPLLDPIPLPAPRGKSEDYGIGVSLLDDKVYLKATYYTTQARDQSTTSTASVRADNKTILDALLAAGLIMQDEYDKRVDVGGHGLFGHESTGVEIELKGNPTKNWSISVGYSESKPVENYRFPEWLKWEEINKQFLSQLSSDPNYPAAIIDPLVADIHDDLAAQTKAVGIGKLGNRRHKYSLFTKYNIQSGWFKGAYIGGGYKQQSKMFTGPHAVTQEILYGNSFWRADALVGYTVQGLKKGRKLSFQLNVNNVFNNRDPLVTRYSSADPTIVTREVVQPPTTWRLTSSFEY